MAEPFHVETATPRKDHLKLAFDGLKGGIKKDLEDLRAKFDQKTKNAIDDLLKKKPDGVPGDILSETENILNALRHCDYHKLTIQQKGDLQRLALGKKLDCKTVKEISNIKAKHQSQEDTQTGASNDATSMPLDELLLVCGEQKKVAELKQKVFKFLNKEINLNSLWAGIVDTVDKLKSVGDTAASSNQTAGLVWGIFKVLLQFAVLSEKGAEAAFSGMQTAVNVMQRAATYEKHIYDPAGRQTLGQPATEPFESCLVSTYQRVFKFLVLASRSFTKNKASLCWYVFWSDKDILEFEQDIFKYEQKLFQDAAIKSLIDQGSKESIIHDLVKDMNAHILGTQERIAEVLSQHSGITLVLQSLKSKVDDIQILMKKSCPDVTRDEMLGWFSAARVEDHHRSAKDKRTINTAEWVLEKQQYLAWSNDTGPSLLWIKGLSGAGKTTIISRLVDTYHECSESQESFAQSQVAYFYCKRDAADRRFSEDIFRSFIRQLASAYHPLPGRLVQTYREKSLKSSLSTKLYEEDYVGLLIELIPRTTETVLILDALDECVGEDTRSSGEIGKVLKTLSRLLDTKLPIKIVVASRYEKRIKHNFNGKHMIEISADDNSNDIEKMVVARINDYNLTDPEVRISRDLKERILKVFNVKSQGKFQWATLHIDHLLDGLTDGILLGALGVEETLGELPEGLIDTYSEIFHRINTKLQKRQKETAFRVFKWLLAMGTCDEKVLIAAICQRLQGQPGDYPNRVEGDAGYILTACQHLVTIQDSRFQFSHLSVDEYLRNHQPELVNTCHYDVAKVCASILFRYRTGEGVMEPWAYFCQNLTCSLPLLRDGQQSFMNELWHFACNQWHVHFQKISSSSQRKDIQTIVDYSFPSAFTTWLNVRVAGLTQLEVPPSIICTTLSKRIFIFEGNRELLLFWGVSLSAQLWAESFTLLPGYGRVLHYLFVVDTAILCGILNKLQRLVKRNMTHEMSLDGYDGRSHDRHRLLHQLFLSIIETNYKRATRRVRIGKGPAELARQLLDSGDISNGQHELLALCEVFIHWRQALTDPITVKNRTAAGFKDVFSKAAHQDQHTEQCQGELARLTLLFISLTEDRELGDFLFDRFPHASTIQYQHLVPPIGFDLDLALVQAATRSDERYINLLLSHGAKVNAQTAEGRPLMAALSNERIENAEVLLQAGADMNGVNLSPIRGYGNITIMACSVQESGLFQFLRKHDAIDMDSVTETGTCLTPLIAACRFGRIDRVTLLLSMRVNIDRRVTTGCYVNALCAAVDGQSMRAIRHLLRRNPSQPKGDILKFWWKKHLRGSTPRYKNFFLWLCQTFLSWLILAILQHPYKEGLQGSDTVMTGCNEIEGGIVNFLWDGSNDSGEEYAISEGESKDDGFGTADHSEDERDRGGEPKQQQDEGRDRHRTDIGSEGGTENNTPTLRTAGRDEGDATVLGDDEVSKKVNGLISGLHSYCVERPAFRHMLAETFGFSLLEQNDSVGVELVRNALHKGFENVLGLTQNERSLNNIVKTWVRFLDLAEDSMGLVSLFENAFDKGDSVELDILHEQVERLANGGVEEGWFR